jgi:hypothetical protein
MNNNNNNEEEIDYDTIYADHIKEMKQKHDFKLSKPVEVKSVEQKKVEQDEDAKKEMETVYKALSTKYCICNHKQKEHAQGYGNCSHEGTRLFRGSLQTFKCECIQFVSIADQAEVNF